MSLLDNSTTAPVTTIWEQHDFRRTLGGFATGITVASCARADGTVIGVTINSMTSVSLNPALILFCLGKTTRCHDDFTTASHFGISILAADQTAISRHFASAQSANWSAIPHFTIGAPHPPLIKEAVGWLSCQRHALYDGGDHTIIVGEVLALGNNANAAPLLYWRGAYHGLADH